VHVPVQAAVECTSCLRADAWRAHCRGVCLQAAVPGGSLSAITTLSLSCMLYQACGHDMAPSLMHMHTLCMQPLLYSCIMQPSGQGSRALAWQAQQWQMTRPCGHLLTSPAALPHQSTSLCSLGSCRLRRGRTQVQDIIRCTSTCMFL
jgi:hypothetical protein